MPGEWILGREFEDVARRTNHNLGSKRQLASKRGAKNRFADLFPDDESPDGTDVHDIEFRELFRDVCRPAAVRSADVYGAEKDDSAHAPTRKEKVEIRK